MKLFCLSLLLLVSLNLTAQVAINTDGSPPDSSAILDLQSSSLGLLIPRMTFIQRNAIENPAEGLVVLCTNCSREGNAALSIFQTGKWMNYTTECFVPGSPYPGQHEAQVTQITWKWYSVSRAKGYKINSTPDLETALDVGTDTSFTETGLVCWSHYWKYIWAYNDCGPSHYMELYERTLPGDFVSPQPDSNYIPSYYSITWQWLPVPGATGYYWNNVNDLSSSIDMNSSYLSWTTYGYYCGNQTDSAYVWAHDDCGISAATMLVQSTDSCPVECMPFTDNRNEKFYNTVLINNQCWMRENLDIGQRIDNSLDQLNNDTIEKYCYNNLDSLCEIYGGLYQWNEMMQYNTLEGSQGICPLGWHLPSKQDWQSLIDFLGGSNIAGSKLKEAGTYHWITDYPASNESALSVLPASGRLGPGWCCCLGERSYFWTTTPSSTPPQNHSKTIQLKSGYPDDNKVFIDYEWNYAGFSVRCLKD